MQSEGAQQDIRSGHMKIYMAGMAASSEAGVELREPYLYSQLTARLQSLAGGCKDPTGARAYKVVEA